MVCLSFTTPLWTKLTKGVSSSIHSGSNYPHKIKINNAHDYDAGVYTCTGTTQDGKQFITNAIIHVAGIIHAVLIITLPIIPYVKIINFLSM